MELNMYKLAEQLKQLREAKKDAEQRVKDINAEIDKTEYSLVQLMAETETQNFTRAGTMFSLTTKTRASAVAGLSPTARRFRPFLDLYINHETRIASLIPK